MKLPRQTFVRILAFAGILTILCLGPSLYAVTNTVTYGYDPLNRLTNAGYSDGSRESYSYDPAGNRLTRITRGPAIHSDTVPPSIPSNLTAQEVSTTQLRLLWNRSPDTGGSGLGGYSIFINNVLYINTTATNQLVSDLSPGSNYIFTVAAFDRAANTSSVSQSLSHTVSSPPAMTVNPTNQTASVGDTISFSVTATGNPSPNYQWWFNGNTPISWGTNATLILTNVQPVAAGSYRVVVTNVAGSVTSLVATLTVNAPATGTVLAWGKNDFGQTNVPVGLSGVTAIAAGGNHSLALKNDSTMVAWGNHYFGQTNVPAGLSGVTAIAAGNGHTAVLKYDGTVVVFGDNSYGQINVPVGLSGVTAIAAGDYHILALRNDRTVVAWGGNQFGQILVPVGLSGVTAIAAGGYHSLALKSDGTVVAWGENNFGGTTIPTTLANVTAIAGGNGYSVALRGDGTVVAWGNNGSGQTAVPESLRGVTAIAAGWFHTVALKDDGTVAAWGNNDNGQTTVPESLRGVTAIAAGHYHTVALVGTAQAVAPAITAQPTNVLLLRTSLVNVLPATFSVVATGTAPLLYQWRFNGSALPGATNPAFNLANVTRVHNGLYSVVVTNTVGTAISSNALLRVRVPQRLALPERLADGRMRLGFIDDLGGLPTTFDAPFIEVQFATNLTASNIFWLPLTNAVTVTNGMLVVDEAPGTVGPHRFYRVIER
ncbi:MAG: Uncharacterized protein FD161_440 [Limisphaerales bacterium]|nr:MAG: Uncharacterized protein FD161_440 [Limisphaerales bacterium]KAG0510345.1 MAG: Uncharacterized protein E1N63_440 [Limisphaerales bacterium]TXT51532.1 MAG: Uncharacterized protein FD140_1570 [Limisphaerales bacterium]